MEAEAMTREAREIQKNKVSKLTLENTRKTRSPSRKRLQARLLYDTGQRKMQLKVSTSMAKSSLQLHFRKMALVMIVFLVSTY